jgi:hypothetical protein
VGQCDHAVDGWPPWTGIWPFGELWYPASLARFDRVRRYATTLGEQMTLAHNLHRFRRLLGLRRSLLPAYLNRRLDESRLHQGWNSGLPVTLDRGVLRSVVRERRNADFVSAGHVSLQEWKTSSAYRLELELSDGTSWSLVYKDARFSDEEYPAAAGLHEPLGIAEYALYSHLTPEMENFIPRVFFMRRGDAPDTYQYLMEDLSPRFHPVYSERDKRVLLDRMPEIHEALATWATVNPPESLLVYDVEFVRHVLHHAENGLKGFASRNGLEAEDAIWRIWPEIVEFLTSDRNLARRHLRPIHGDFNTKNAFLSSRRRSGEVRLVDWEWFGMGTPHDDVASLLKRHNPSLKEHALRMLADRADDLSVTDHRELLWWSRLFTAVLDASLLSHQELGLSEAPPVVARRARGLWNGLLRTHANLTDEVAL